MKKPVRFDSDADSELTAACEWYEQQCVGLGTEILEAIDETIARIVEYPGLGALYPQVPEELGVRRVLVKRFRTQWRTSIFPMKSESSPSLTPDANRVTGASRAVAEWAMFEPPSDRVVEDMDGDR